MKHDAQRAQYILSFLFKDCKVEYNHGQMKYTVSIGNTYYKEYYDENDYNSFMTFILYIVEINIWKLHNVEAILNGNELVYKINNMIVDNNQLLNIHAEDKKQIINTITNMINQINNKFKSVSDLVVDYNDSYTYLNKITNDINNLKSLSTTFLGKIKIYSLKSKNLINFTKDEDTPNRNKIYDDLYDILKIIKSDEKDYKECIYKYFNTMKENIESGYLYTLDYSKFQSSFTSSDLFLLNKILNIINYLLDMTANTITSNKNMVDKKISELETLANDIKISNTSTICKNVSTYNIDTINYISFNKISYDNLKADNNLINIIKLYEDIKYIEN